MESKFTKRVKAELQKYQDTPALIVKLQTEGLLNQLEKVLSYAYESADDPDENYKENLKLVINQIIELIWDENSENKFK